MPRLIINFPTKQHWRARSRLADIEAGLSSLVAEVERHHIRSIALPPLGCGLGGLDWTDVKPRIHRALVGVADLDVLVFEPHGADSVEVTLREENRPPMTPGRAALLGLIEGGGAGGDRTDQPLNLIPGAMREAEKFLSQHPETRGRFDRVVDLVVGFESPFGLELLATVHWVINEIHTDETPDVVRAAYAWNNRKRQFSERQIELARDTLRGRGWLG